MKNKFISISGTMGIGKSTLTTFIAREFNYLPIYENFKDNHFLSRFYLDMKRWAYHSQTFFLIEKAKQIHEINNFIKKKSIVQDTPIYQDVFSYAQAHFIMGNMEKAEWDQYCEIYKLLEDKLIIPDVIIHLTTPINIIYDRIKNRDRGFERKNNKRQFVSYLKILNRLNNQWINKIKRKIKVIEIDITEFNYMNNKIEKEKMKAKIRQII